MCSRTHSLRKKFTRFEKKIAAIFKDRRFIKEEKVLASSVLLVDEILL